MNKVWSTLVVASFGAFFVTGCMTPDVSTYQPQAGDIGMRAYGSSGCIDFEQEKANMLAEQQEWHESHVVATTPEPIRSEALVSTTSVAADEGWVEISPVQTASTVSVADDEGWVEISPSVQAF